MALATEEQQLTFPKVVARLEGVDQKGVFAAGVAVPYGVGRHRIVVQLQLVGHSPRHETVARAATAVLAHPPVHQPGHAQRDAEGDDGDVHAGDHHEGFVSIRRAVDAVVFYQHAQVHADSAAVELKDDAFSSVCEQIGHANSRNHMRRQYHAEGLVAHARVAQEDDDERVSLRIARRRRPPDPPPLVAVL